MLITDLVDRRALECTEDMRLSAVYALMRESQDDIVVVLDSQAHRIPIGVVTEHEICEHVVGRRRDPRHLSAANVMSSRFAKAAEKLSAEECRRAVRSGTPVVAVDSQGAFLGVIRREVLEAAGGAESAARVYNNARPAIPSNWVH